MKTFINFCFFFLVTAFCFSQVQRLPFQNQEILPPDMHDADYEQLCNYLDARFLEVGIEYDDNGRIIDNDYLKYRRWKHDWSTRLDADGNFPSLEMEDALIKLKLNALKKTDYKNDFEDWEAKGPFTRSGGYWGMGRVMAIDFHPTDENTFFVGAAKGGIWKTTDGGQSYESLGDQLPYHSVTNLVVNKDNPDIITISLGDRTGWWEYSIGIYRTEDGGQTWNPTNLNIGLSDRTTIFDMKASPVNSNLILAATADGVYRTVDGQTFEKVKIGLPNIGFSSLYPLNIAFHPTDDQIIYLSWFDYWGNQSAIFKSESAGQNWIEIAGFDSEPNTTYTLAVTPAQPDKLVVKVQSNEEAHIMISHDQGTTWTDRQDQNDVDGRILYVSPVTPDRIFSGYFYVWGSNDDGENFQKISAWDINDMHVDQWFIKHNPLNNKIYWCNDGGVYSFEETGSKWTELNNGLAITQMYDISVSQNIPGFYIMGSQDNGGAAYSPILGWTNTNGGDGMTNAMNPMNHENYFTTYPLGIEIYRTNNSWFTVDRVEQNVPAGYINEANWLSPICMNPLNPDEVFIASKNIYKSNDNGFTWLEIKNKLSASAPVRKIEVSPADGESIYCIAENFIWMSNDEGLNWNINAVSGSSISNFELHPDNPNKLWITVGGFTVGQKVMYSDDGLSSFKNLTGNLPNIPVHCILFDDVSNTLFVGTEIGMYYSDADDINWTLMTNGLPFTQVNDLELQKTSRKLYAGTYGRGMYELTLPEVVTNNEDLSDVQDCMGLNLRNQILSIQTKSNAEISINDALGRLVMQEKTAIDLTELDVSNLTTGVYVVSLSKGGRIICTEKISIK